MAACRATYADMVYPTKPQIIDPDQ